MNDESLKMELTKYQNVNTQHAAIENFERLYGVVFYQPKINKFYKKKRDENGIVISKSDASDD